MSITFTKRVSLDFLGDEYKGSYIDFKAIPVKNYKAIQDDIKNLEGNDNNTFGYMQNLLETNFIGGKLVQGEKEIGLAAENIGDLPGNAFLDCYKSMMGTPDPN